MGFREKAVMPVIFAELASTYRPSEVRDPASFTAAANGQYILISRDAYDAVGGYAAVATSLLEDVALAKAVKATKDILSLRRGCGTNPHVSQFCANKGRLDQESLCFCFARQCDWQCCGSRSLFLSWAARRWPS